MIPLGRTLVGLLVGGMVARVLSLLAWLHIGPNRIGQRATRRTFLRNAALGSAGAMSGLIGAGFGFLMWPNKTGAFGSEIQLTADVVPAVGGEPYRNVPGKFFLIRNETGLLALYTKCPHLGCTVPYTGPADSPHAFQCPCHGSKYDYTGERTGGPAPRPMDYMKVTVNDDGSVAVDTGDIRTRGAYAPDQAAAYTL